MAVDIEQSQHEQKEQRQPHLDAVQIVEVTEHVSDELVSHPEQFDAVGQSVEVEFQEQRVVAVGLRGAEATGWRSSFRLQHDRILVHDDCLRLQHGHLLVDRLKLLIQPETVDHETYFRQTNADVLHVHQRVENQHVSIARVVVNQVYPQYVRRQYDDNVREHDGHGENTMKTLFRTAYGIVELVDIDLSLVFGKIAYTIIQTRDSRNETRYGERSRVHRLYRRYC